MGSNFNGIQNNKVARSSLQKSSKGVLPNSFLKIWGKNNIQDAWSCFFF